MIGKNIIYEFDKLYEKLYDISCNYRLHEKTYSLHASNCDGFEREARNVLSNFLNKININPVNIVYMFDRVLYLCKDIVVYRTTPVEIFDEVVKRHVRRLYHNNPEYVGIKRRIEEYERGIEFGLVRKISLLDKKYEDSLRGIATKIINECGTNEVTLAQLKINIRDIRTCIGVCVNIPPSELSKLTEYLKFTNYAGYVVLFKNPPSSKYVNSYVIIPKNKMCIRTSRRGNEYIKAFKYYLISNEFIKYLKELRDRRNDLVNELNAKSLERQHVYEKECRVLSKLLIIDFLKYLGINFNHIVDVLRESTKFLNPKTWTEAKNVLRRLLEYFEVIIFDGTTEGIDADLVLKKEIRERFGLKDICGVRVVVSNDDVVDVRLLSLYDVTEKLNDSLICYSNISLGTEYHVFDIVSDKYTIFDFTWLVHKIGGKVCDNENVDRIIRRVKKAYVVDRYVPSLGDEVVLMLLPTEFVNILKTSIDVSNFKINSDEDWYKFEKMFFELLESFEPMRE